MSRHKFAEDLVGSVIGSPRMASKYRKLMEDPRERRVTEYFGRKSVRGSVACIICSIIGIICAVGLLLVADVYKVDPTVVFVAFGSILLLAASVIFVVYPFVFLIRVFRYAKFQRNLNDLRVGRKAKRLAVFATLLNIVAVVIVAILIVMVIAFVFSA